MQELANKVAIVTGGGYGIGRQIALVFARAGAHVVLAARSVDKLESTRKEIAGLGAQCLAIPTDVAKDADCTRMAEQTVSRFGRIDILVNNAGIEGATKLTTDMTPEEWREVIDIDRHVAGHPRGPAGDEAAKSRRHHQHLFRIGPPRLSVPCALLGGEMGDDQPDADLGRRMGPQRHPR